MWARTGQSQTPSTKALRQDPAWPVQEKCRDSYEECCVVRWKSRQGPNCGALEALGPFLVFQEVPALVPALFIRTHCGLSEVVNMVMLTIISKD
jgi:hypothetical protein